LRDAAGLGFGQPLTIYTDHGAVTIPSYLVGAAQFSDEAAIKHLLLRKIEAAEARIKQAIGYKERVVETIHLGIFRPGSGGCEGKPGLGPSPKARDAAHAVPPAGRYVLAVACRGKIRESVLFLPTVKIRGAAGYLTPGGAHLCRHDAHEVDCRIESPAKRLTFFADTTPAPTEGLTGVFGAVVTGHRVSVFRAPPLAPPPKPQMFRLVVSKQGDGSGVVQSSPGGILCGSVCTATFQAGTKVKLVPTASPGSFFDVFSGDCTGSGPCEVTMDRDRSVTASFAAPPTCTSGLMLAPPPAPAGTVSGNLQCMRDATGFSITAQKAGQTISSIVGRNQTTGMPLNCTAAGTTTATCNGALAAGQTVQFAIGTSGAVATSGDTFAITVTNGSTAIFTGTSTVQ
jgi:hypothetical protein